MIVSLHVIVVKEEFRERAIGLGLRLSVGPAGTQAWRHWRRCLPSPLNFGRNFGSVLFGATDEHDLNSQQEMGMSHDEQN